MKKILPWAAMTAGAAYLALLTVLSLGLTRGQVSYTAPTLVGLGLGGGLLLLVGLASRRAVAPDARRDPRHAYPLLGLVGLGIGGLLLARHALVPDSFGRQGHFRGLAPREARRYPVRHQGEKACTECHGEVLALHAKDAHARVACEVCHGAAHAHLVQSATKPKVVRSQEACLMCHQRLRARPSSFPQIDVAEHYRLVGVRDPKLSCTACHSPHEPLFVDRDLRKARLHPLVHRCRDCHAGRSDDNIPKPAAHPPIFDCQYCHQERVADFATRKHKSLRCSTCHIFRKETAFAGRIVRDSDPRFCLLCHRKTPFRDAKAAPGIEPEKHLKDMGAAPKASCLECHRDAIHREPPKVKP